jgi:hypothetical protein
MLAATVDYVAACVVVDALVVVEDEGEGKGEWARLGLEISNCSPIQAIVCGRCCLSQSR